MPLSDAEYQLVNYIEQEYFLSGLVPGKSNCVTRLGITESFYDKCYKSETFRNALAARGITLKGASGEPGEGLLTAEQIATVRVLFDLKDTRSHKKKLADLGINTQTYSGWLKDPAFQHYMRQVGENLLGDNMHEAHAALVDSVSRGDVSALKLYYEMTGRWSSKSTSEIPIDFILMKVLEAIQKHVSDPATLEAIANDLEILAPSPLAMQGRSQPQLTSGFDL